MGNEIGFKTADAQLALQLKTLKSAIEVAWWARNGKGKEARRALRVHMADLNQLCGVTEFKDTQLADVLKAAGL